MNKNFLLEIKLEDENDCKGCCCLVYYESSYTSYYFCNLKDRFKLDGPRPDWCPLKEVEK